MDPAPPDPAPPPPAQPHLTPRVVPRTRVTVHPADTCLIQSAVTTEFSMIIFAFYNVMLVLEELILKDNHCHSVVSIIGVHHLTFRILIFICNLQILLSLFSCFMI